MAAITKSLQKNFRSDPVGGLSRRPVCVVVRTDTIAEVVETMAARGVGCVLVLDGGPTQQLVGIFTEADFLCRVVATKLDVEQSIESVMTRSPKVIDESASVLQAMELMEQGHIRHLPVIGDGGRSIGILTLKDIIHYLVEYFPATVYNLPPTPSLTQPAREVA
jgi:CBS domain-containing protein